MAPKKLNRKDVDQRMDESETPKKATLKRTRRELVVNQGDFSGTVQDVADLSGDDWTETQEPNSQAMTKKDKKKKQKKQKKAKVEESSPAESSDDSKEEEEEGDNEDSDEDAEQFFPPVKDYEELESKPDNDNMATCFFKDIWYEQKKYTFVYLKRKDKCVNLQMSCVPWLIQKLCFYYSIRGTDLCKALAALNEGRNRIIQVMREAKITNTDIVKELKITKKELA